MPLRVGGGIIGNHGYDHPHFSDLSVAECFEQISKTDLIISEIYKKAKTKRPVKFFRFPYGDKGGLKHNEVFEPYEGEGKIRKEKIQNFLRDLGYTQPKLEGITYKYYRKAGLLDDVDWHWTYDVMEWTTFQAKPLYGIDSLEKVLARMKENVPEGCRGLNYSGSEEIILVHDHEQTGEMFKPIIEWLISKGIIFKSPSIG